MNNKEFTEFYIIQSNSTTMIQSGFIALSAVTVLTIFYLILAHKKAAFQFTCFILLWLLYLVLLERSALLETFDLPPRLPLFVIVPVVFIMFRYTGSKGFSGILHQLPLHLPILLQSFRIMVELLIFGAFSEGIFSQRVTFEGLNFDVLSGITALITGVLIKKHLAEIKLILAWNIFSIIILSVTVYAFISTYYSPEYRNISSNFALVRWPYLLLPSILLPAAVFMHFISLRQVFIRSRLQVSHDFSFTDNTI